MKRLFVLAALASLTACNPPSEFLGDSGVRGRVLAGPQCPVVIKGSPCPDLPARAGIRVIDASDGNVLRRAHSDDGGRFEVVIEAGRYFLEAMSEGTGFPGGGERVLVLVRSHRFTRVTLHLDTGIR